MDVQDVMTVSPLLPYFKSSIICSNKKNRYRSHTYKRTIPVRLHGTFSVSSFREKLFPGFHLLNTDQHGVLALTNTLKIFQLPLYLQGVCRA